jgi:hypothetical protein
MGEEVREPDVPVHVSPLDPMSEHEGGIGR